MGASRPGQGCPVERSGCLDLELLPCGENSRGFLLLLYFQGESSWVPPQCCQRGGNRPVLFPWRWLAACDGAFTVGLRSCNQNVNTVEKPSVSVIRGIRVATDR